MTGGGGGGGGEGGRFGISPQDNFFFAGGTTNFTEGDISPLLRSQDVGLNIAKT